MEMKITSLEGNESGSVTLSDTIFGLEPRVDLIQRCVNWQLAKRQAGTHKSKGRSEINRTTKKMYRQKGTGSARHGSRRADDERGPDPARTGKGAGAGDHGKLPALCRWQAVRRRDLLPCDEARARTRADPGRIAQRSEEIVPTSRP